MNKEFNQGDNSDINQNIEAYIEPKSNEINQTLNKSHNLKLIKGALPSDQRAIQSSGQLEGIEDEKKVREQIDLAKKIDLLHIEKQKRFYKEFSEKKKEAFRQ